jgi:hypothetical protein
LLSSLLFFNISQHLSHLSHSAAYCKEGEGYIGRRRKERKIQEEEKEGNRRWEDEKRKEEEKQRVEYDRRKRSVRRVERRSNKAESTLSFSVPYPSPFSNLSSVFKSPQLFTQDIRTPLLSPISYFYLGGAFNGTGTAKDEEEVNLATSSSNNAFLFFSSSSFSSSLISDGPFFQGTATPPCSLSTFESRAARSNLI